MKPKPSQPAQRRTRGFLGRYWGLLLVFVLVLMAAGSIYAYHVHGEDAVKADKARFTQAQSDVPVLAKSIEDGVGKPDDSRKRSYCEESVVEFGTNTIGCNIGAYLAYEVKNADDVNQLVRNTERVFDFRSVDWQARAVTQKPSEDSELFVPLQADDKAESLTKTFFGSGDMICDISYDFFKTTTYINPTINLVSNGEYTLLISVGCGGPALKNHF